PPIITALDVPLLAPGETAPVHYSATDPEGGPLDVMVSVADGAWSISGAQITAPMANDASATVTLTVEDDHGNVATASTQAYTTPNRPPVIGSLVASPSSVAPGGVQTLTLAVDDPDDDTLTIA